MPPPPHRSHHRHRTAQYPSLSSLPEHTAPRLHPLETALLAVVGAHLVFLPWALGTMHVWSQCVSLGFAALGLSLALRTRFYSEDLGGGRAFQLRMLPKLLHFPIFWLGLMFLAYILIQAINPAWEYVTDGRSWWLEGVSCNEWLPTGMRTPFSQANPWRSLMIYASAWMTVCAIWTGCTRRKTLRMLMVLLAVNAFLLALFGLIERASHASKVFWVWQPPASYFVSSFIYRNHAGAYFNLMLAVTCGLAFWYFLHQIRHDKPSSPAVVFAFFATVIAAIVLYSYSRGATLLMVSFIAAVALIAGRKLLTTAGADRSTAAAILVGVFLAAFLIVGISSLKTDQITERMRGIEEERRAGSENTRLVVARATWDMARDALAFGWGAGSYRYYFPVYQARHPEICIARDNHKMMGWEHAHDDYLELLAELGAAGCGLLAAALFVGFTRLLQLRLWRHPLVFMLFLGCLVTMVHATFDFPFFNPAILITWCCLWPVMVRWIEIEAQRRNPSPKEAA